MPKQSFMSGYHHRSRRCRHVIIVVVVIKIDWHCLSVCPVMPKRSIIPKRNFIPKRSFIAAIPPSPFTVCLKIPYPPPSLRERASYFGRLVSLARPAGCGPSQPDKMKPLTTPTLPSLNTCLVCLVLYDHRQSPTLAKLLGNTCSVHPLL